MNDNPKIQTLANSAKVERHDVQEHPGRSTAKALVCDSAMILRPSGAEFQGSFVVHMFKTPGQDNFAFVFQMIGLDAIPEGQVDVALKELRRQLMGQYGRKEKSRFDL